MAELLLVSNPKRRRKARKARARRRRRRGMPAGLRRYLEARRANKGGATRRRRRRRRTSVARVHRRRRSAIAVRHHRRRRNPHRRHFRRRRNPMSLGGIKSAFMPTLKAGAWGAGGALGLDVLWGLLVGNLPSLAAYLTNPYVGYLAKAGGAVVVGSVGGNFFRGHGRELAVGAMTVVTHDFAKSLLQSMLPTVFGTGGSLPLGSYLSGAGPIVGTLSNPRTFLPQQTQFGAYLNGGGADGAGDSLPFNNDLMGVDPWADVN